MLEASAFNVFGLKITQDDIGRIFEAFTGTYDALKERNPKWRSADFCKTQIVALWENISSFLDRVDLEKVGCADSKYLTAKLHLNTENEEFLRLLGKFSDDAMWLISRFEEIHVGASSVHLDFKDSTTNQRQHVVLDLHKIRRQLRRYTLKVGNALKQFVDWVLKHKRTVITCILISGVVTITIFAGLWTGGAVIPFAKLIVPLVISIICLIAETVSVYGDFDRFQRSLKLRGITLY